MNAQNIVILQPEFKHWRKKYVKIFYANKSKLKNGIVPIMGRVTINGTQSQFSCKQSIPLDLWDVKGNRAKGRSREALQLNRDLDNIKAQLIKHYQHLSDKEGFVTAEMVRNAYQGLGSEYETLLNAFDKDIASFKKRVGKDRVISTLWAMQRSRKNVAEFIQLHYRRSDMSMLELTPQFIEEFATYLSTERGLASGTIWQTCMWLKGVVMRAHYNGKIPRNPFAQFHIIPNCKEREFLTEDELKQVMTHEFEEADLAFVRDIFVFICWTALAFVDVKNLTTDDIVDINGDKWIVSHRHKTNVPYQVKLMDVPLQIIERYKHLQEVEEDHCRLRDREADKSALLASQLGNFSFVEWYAHRERKPSIGAHQHRHHSDLCPHHHSEVRQ